MLKRYLEQDRVEAGCDEAGRGCLAGPVYAAAVVLDPKRPIKGLDDSKKISEKKRDQLRAEIEDKAMCWAVARCDVLEIDEINILNASILAMQKAIGQLQTRPDHLLIDGNRFKPFDSYSYSTIIKGDGKFQSIAAASILAKTHRDEYMKELASQFPNYGFDKHKGYGTKQHIQAIEDNGYTDHHRKTFKLKKLQLNLF